MDQTIKRCQDLEASVLGALLTAVEATPITDHPALGLLLKGRDDPTHDDDAVMNGAPGS